MKGKVGPETNCKGAEGDFGGDNENVLYLCRDSALHRSGLSISQCSEKDYEWCISFYVQFTSKNISNYEQMFSSNESYACWKA